MLLPVRDPQVLAAALLATSLLVLPAGTTAQTPDSTALDRSLTQVDERRADGAFRDALSRLSELRDRHGDRAAILWRMSLVRVDIGKSADTEEAAQQHYRAALTLAEKALTVKESSADAHLARAVAEGRLALDAGRQERVERSRAVKRHADRAIALDSTLAGAYHVRGRWHREVSDLNFLERTVVRTVYGGLPDASFEEAVQNFRRAIALEDERFHHLELAKTYLMMDRPDDARAQLETVLEMPGRTPFADRYAEEAQELLADLDGGGP
jgi:tetratricopeptide (TPR) repeat protein